MQLPRTPRFAPTMTFRFKCQTKLVRTTIIGSRCFGELVPFAGQGRASREKRDQRLFSLDYPWSVYTTIQTSGGCNQPMFCVLFLAYLVFLVLENEGPGKRKAAEVPRCQQQPACEQAGPRHDTILYALDTGIRMNLYLIYTRNPNERSVKTGENFY